MIRTGLALMILLSAVSASAQSVVADRFVFNTGPCTLRSGSGPPEGVVTGKICDTYWRTDAGIVYIKVLGTGNTGWITMGGVSGTGTANTLAKWTTTTNIANSTITDDGTAITFSNAGDINFNPGGNDVLPTTGYDINLGHLTKKYLTLHAAELWVETLVAQNTIATIGGRIVVAPANILTRDLLSGDFTGAFPSQQTSNFCVKYSSFKLHVFAVELGSKIIMQANNKFEAFTVLDETIPTVTGSGDYCYTVLRNNDNTGTNDWYAGDAALDTGKTTNGFIDLYSLSGLRSGTEIDPPSGVIAPNEIGPTIVGNVRDGPDFNDWSPRWAIGNLDGLYSYSGSAYGAVFGAPEGPVVAVDDINGIRMYDGALNLRIHLTTGGEAIFNGDGDSITNIDGGNIQTNTVTVGQLLATGFGDNLVKNGTFEGDTAAKGLAGWIHDIQGTGLFPTHACCGVNGPGAMLFNPVDGFTMGAVYLANPVLPGQTYRVSGKYYANTTSTAGWYVGMQEWSTATNGVRYVHRLGAASATSPDVEASTATYLCSNCGVTGGAWQTFEYTYTVPSGVYWASFSFFNQTGTVSTSTYTAIYVDDIEVQKKIGAGHIIANSITAGQIAAGTITAGQIAANTITANEIAANAITTSELDADSVTSAKISAGTIEASDIAASTITADKLNVTTLSAITANLGTVTAGTIDGVTIIAGSGDQVTLDASGITLTNGAATQNRIKWGADTSYITAITDGQMVIHSDDIFMQPHVAGQVSVAGEFAATTASLGAVRLGGLFAGSGTSRFVCHDNDGDLYSSGSTCDGSAPAPQAAARIEALEREVAELRVMVQQLLERNR